MGVIWWDKLGDFRGVGGCDIAGGRLRRGELYKRFYSVRLPGGGGLVGACGGMDVTLFLLAYRRGKFYIGLQFVRLPPGWHF